MKKITLFRPYVSWLARFYVLKVLMGTQLAEGPVVKCFEHEFAKRFRKKNVVAVNSGTSALELAYDLAGIGAGDEVITPVLTCTATNLPLVRRGAKIVFADINETLNLDIEDVERKITERTKAIVFVHFGGNSSGLGQLLVLARRFNIRVIEDAAQSVGESGFAWGKADFTCVSLQAIKTLTAGDGGFLICRDTDDYEKAKKLRWFGYDRALKQKLGDTDLTIAGYKYHMNDVNAAIGLGNLRALGYALRKRRQVRDWYREEWEAHGLPLSDLRLYPWLVILVHPRARAVDTLLKRYDIGSGPYHYRNDKYTIFHRQEGNSHVRDLLPNMHTLQESYTLLPFHHKITRKNVEQIVRLAKIAMQGNIISNNSFIEHGDKG